MRKLIKNQPPVTGHRPPVTGFTLIELLVVMAILGVLATVGLANYQGAQAKARDARRKSDLGQVQTAAETYFSDHREYPNNSASGQIICIDSPQTICDWGEEFADENGTIYIARLPADPSGGRRYFYDTDADRLKFKVMARLENCNDPSRINPAAACGESPSGESCGDGVCNYGIASGNARPDEVL